MGLGILVLGLAVFLGTHVFVSFRDARAGAIARLGLHSYRALFALVSLAGLALIVWGYGQYRSHELIQVWSPPGFMRHITVGLIFSSGRTLSYLVNDLKCAVSAEHTS